MHGLNIAFSYFRVARGPRRRAARWFVSGGPRRLGGSRVVLNGWTTRVCARRPLSAARSKTSVGELARLLLPWVTTGSGGTRNALGSTFGALQRPPRHLRHLRPLCRTVTPTSEKHYPPKMVMEASAVVDCADVGHGFGRHRQHAKRLARGSRRPISRSAALAHEQGKGSDAIRGFRNSLIPVLKQPVINQLGFKTGD